MPVGEAVDRRLHLEARRRLGVLEPVMPPPNQVHAPVVLQRPFHMQIFEQGADGVRYVLDELRTREVRTGFGRIPVDVSKRRRR